MGENSDDDVLEISRDDYVHKVDEALRKDYGFFFSHEERDVDQDAIAMKERVGETIKAKQHDFDCTSKGTIDEGCQSLKNDVKENISSSGSSKTKKRLHGNKSRKPTIHEDPEVLNFTRKGEYRLRLPVGVSNRAGFSKKLHTLKFENLQGQVTVYEVKREKNGRAVRYSVINWPLFMTENNLNDGDMLDFTYLTSKKTVILKKVRYV
ncbi:putative transcription factor B3-Domain family [Helianthus annuus]|uniref:Transcription factor B3-Domain family n=1 Tax=Helianthus annuus TaxID=4232 RepID=A0A9K3JU77_HELAN|nr:putative transcription factor B3-Domain family [Helianthus annuus]KAJ0610524.1 putative transcription factor B3-Domain family [Helianthus annuus]KAJ0621247.1 putative transcription factor B3-Domain family [Helianthus annuus]KAJ0625770.1 putative transcription factor B3-Domain family [Helianthus annuus]KAJ0782140.1 putative transcription factor B3-Domain family [Helianthus annuus]